MAIEIVDLPMKNGDFPHSYVNVYQRVALSIWWFPEMEVTPSHHPFIDGFSMISQPFWGFPICENLNMVPKRWH